MRTVLNYEERGNQQAQASRKKREQVDRRKGERIIGDCCAEGKRGDIEKRNTGSQAAELVKS